MTTFLILKVASLVCVSNLKNWINEPFSQGFLTKGFEAMKDVAYELVYNKLNKQQLTNTLEYVIVYFHYLS